MSGRRWTDSEDAIVRAEYHQVPAAQIAAELGRTMRQVYARAGVLGLSVPQPLITRHVRLREWVAFFSRRGWLDSEIANAWTEGNARNPIDRRSVCEVRRSLGLPSNANNERHRQQVRERTQQQLAAAGVESLAEVRAAAYRQFAIDRGWPDYLRPRHVQILDVLYERGPQTRLAIATAIGWRVDRGQRRLLSCCYGRGSYLADLMAAGLVVQSKYREVRGSGKGQSVHRYFIAAGIVRGNAATWPEEDWSRGQIYGAKQVDGAGGSRESAATAGGADVPSSAAGGRGRGGGRK